MRVAGLFAGIGGLELGLARAGCKAELFCEIDGAAAEVLMTRFPDVPVHGDIRTLSDLPANIDLLCAGFPCQDLSQAGRTTGLSGSRSGLVNEIFRLLDRRRVPLVVLENVPFMLQLARGNALTRIVDELERLGYRWAYRVVNTLAFGLPQRRERVFLVAALDRDPADILLVDDERLPAQESAIGQLAHGFYWTEGVRGLGWAVDAVPTLKNGSTVGIPSPPAILLPNGLIIKPDVRDAERMQGFSTDWTQPAENVKRAGFRWALVGNAVSVPVAEWLGRRLQTPGRYDVHRDRALSLGQRWPKAARFGGSQRFAVEVSTAPKLIPKQHLHEFLQFSGMPLSRKATAGFLSRTKTSCLRFPRGFLESVERHLRRMEIEEPKAEACLISARSRKRPAASTAALSAAE